MIVSVSGMGYVGAGAAYDLLSEYDNVEYKSNSFEFGLLYEADGIVDLVNKLTLNNSKITSYVPIRRFLNLAKFYSEFEWFSPYTRHFLYKEAEIFIKRLGVIEYSGFQVFDYANLTSKEKMIINLNSFFSKIKKRMGLPSVFPYSKKMYVYLQCDDIKKEAALFMSKVFNQLRLNTNSILLIKHLCPPDIPEICFPYFEEEIRHISLTRDPRDLYVLGKINNTNDFPCNTVDNFISFYKKAFSIQNNNNTNIQVVPFEDFCYKYDETVKKLEGFIGLQPSQHQARTHFNPDISINNTKIYLRHPEFDEDIKVIEKSLSAFLYSFNS